MGRMWTAAVCAAAVLTAGVVDATSAAATGNPASGWGQNTLGQLGDGTTTNREVPVPVAELSEVVAVSAGGDHTLALMSDGTVRAWGSNNHGQLGNGSTTNSSTAVTVKELGEVVAVSAGPEYSMALLESGKIVTWGLNSSGQLGNGTTTSSSVPVEVKGITEAVGIFAAPTHALAVIKGGTVEDWGANESGSLGNGSFTGTSTEPVAVSEVSEAVAVSGGESFSVALLSNGKVKAWGENRLGQLGTGNSSGPSKCTRKVGPETEEYGCSATAVAVSELSGVTKIASGVAHTLALQSGGTVKAWGENERGQLGTGSATGPNSCPEDFEVEVGIVISFSVPCAVGPVTVSSLSGVSAVSAGRTHSLALLTSGAVESWGEGGLGQYGSSAVYEPAVVAGVGAQVAIAAGGDDSFSVGPLAPTVGGVSPGSGSGSGGTSVTITGSRFTEVSAVKFGTVSATSVTVKSSTELSAVTPGHKLGVVDVTVVTSHGTSARVAADRFTYVPETLDLGRCANVGTGFGTYKNSACSELQEGGKFKWTPGAEKAGISYADSTETVEKVEKPKKVIFETTGKSQLVCTNLGGGGEYVGTTTVAGASFKLTGCTFGGSSCRSPGAAEEGEVVTATLAGTLGWREKTGNLVGIGFGPATEAAAFLEATCPATSTTIKVTGSVIGAITPVNNMSSAFTLKFKQSKGVQTVEHFQGEEAVQTLRMSINNSISIQTGLSFEGTQGGEEELEINTVI